MPAKAGIQYISKTILFLCFFDLHIPIFLHSIIIAHQTCKKDAQMNLDPSTISTQPLDHLGLISAVIQDIGLESKIDSKLPIDTKMGAYISMGKRVHAMILNGLGFVNTRLYMFSKFFEHKPLARLLGEGILAEHLNDDAMGRCLDSIYEYGCTKFYAEIASRIAIDKIYLAKPHTMIQQLSV